MIEVSLMIESDELGLVEAGLTLALRRKARLTLREETKPKTCNDLILGFVRSGVEPRTKSEIKDYIELHGYARSGAGPACSELLKSGQLIRTERAKYVSH